VSDFEPDRIWITWCDQVGIRTETLSRISVLEKQAYNAMIVPIIRKKQPYIHFDMDDSGRICRVLQRREGDEMPETGNNDMGFFLCHSMYIRSWIQIFLHLQGSVI